MRNGKMIEFVYLNLKQIDELKVKNLIKKKAEARPYLL